MLANCIKEQEFRYHLYDKYLFLPKEKNFSELENNNNKTKQPTNQNPKYPPLATDLYITQAS
jgi:hypothetical protein